MAAADRGPTAAPPPRADGLTAGRGSRADGRTMRSNAYVCSYVMFLVCTSGIWGGAIFQGLLDLIQIIRDGRLDGVLDNLG